MRLKMHQGTANTSRPSLCYSCRKAHRVRMAHTNEEVVRCGYNYEHPLTIRGVVAECSLYDNKTHPTLADMREIAWRISSDKHRAIGFQSPAEFKKATKEEGGDGWETFRLPDGTTERYHDG